MAIYVTSGYRRKQMPVGPRQAWMQSTPTSPKTPDVIAQGQAG